ncbi:hypothetical protein PoB_006257300 [Plakobranchus ocellatus]|uniref:Uncharacterized protein n=1 Tax=Plakobranchus ocellatus TaxID=259542 RepID=A0AAV4CW21_9GAST|nr:hypothetical protein PoB_006257300 [Plakobranchus ocellatus]
MVLSKKSSFFSNRTFFNIEFNIFFGYPGSDTCSAYDQFKVKIEVLTKTLTDTPNEAVRRELEKLKNPQELHQRKAETFYHLKKDVEQEQKQLFKWSLSPSTTRKNHNRIYQSTSDFIIRGSCLIN